MGKFTFWEQDPNRSIEVQSGFVCAASEEDALKLFGNRPTVAICAIPDDVELPPGTGPVFVTRHHLRGRVEGW